MKKTLIYLLIVALFISIFAGNATAANMIPVAFAVTSAQGGVGDVVAIDILVSARSEVGALELSVLVPTEYLDIASVINARGKEEYSTLGPSFANVAEPMPIPIVFKNCHTVAKGPYWRQRR